MKKVLHFILKILAKLVIRKYQPKVVGITGSVGKTSAKEAVYCVLKDNFKTRRSVKNYNNEIGTPLTILGWSNSPGKNLFRWLVLLVRSIKLIVRKDTNYPEVLILEMGADRPGDIKYLISIAKPNIAVMTAIGPSHIEYFGSLKKIVKEKSSILKDLKDKDWAIINRDDPELSGVIDDIKNNLLTFGQREDSDIHLMDVKITKRDEKYGTSFKLRNKGSEVPMFLPAVLGWQHAQAAATACAVGVALGLNMVEISKSLSEYEPARGRTNLISGVKYSQIIDDTYNASPQSSKVALNILAEFPSEGRKIAVFGDMLELGEMSEEGHREVGRDLVKLGVDYLFVIGERARDISRAAKESGMPEDKIFHFPFTMEAGVFLQERIKPGDVILVKGSRGSKMEQMVYEIMAKPWESRELLVGPVIK
ncbi:UDP-N-acetylmuramoyl-tripeptide--D-alanyl-D-alanine ligase [Candidatus Parcubacteria bacterium]|jgi:UDP-N-acetylmuramoyl-tripeptide--D-alanyl-D-alanine ligase|nr:UDP-N-acetylmuramoyl-tripeptide--D-alanyl-D-alanine ligase [Candidatus Parcubacteria bacterium]